jgi:hypothetical protein
MALIFFVSRWAAPHPAHGDNPLPDPDRFLYGKQNRPRSRWLKKRRQASGARRPNASPLRFRAGARIFLPYRSVQLQPVESNRSFAMPVVKCPFCGKKGAILDPEMLKVSVLTCESITCKNPVCKCYDPVTYGYHDQMSDDLKVYYDTYLQVRKQEAD